jgi:heme A synthase
MTITIPGVIAIFATVLATYAIFAGTPQSTSTWRYIRLGLLIVVWAFVAAALFIEGARPQHLTAQYLGSLITFLVVVVLLTFSIVLRVRWEKEFTDRLEREQRERRRLIGGGGLKGAPWRGRKWPQRNDVYFAIGIVVSVASLFIGHFWK